MTLDGALLKTGQIRFVPVDGQTPTAGAVITDGQYSATVAPGQKTVEISSPTGRPRAIDVRQLASARAEGADGDLVPAKYNAQTELKIEVRPGAEPHNFELFSK